MYLTCLVLGIQALSFKSCSLVSQLSTLPHLPLLSLTCEVRSKGIVTMAQAVILQNTGLAVAKIRLENARQEVQSRQEADKVNTCIHNAATVVQSLPSLLSFVFFTN